MPKLKRQPNVVAGQQPQPPEQQTVVTPNSEVKAPRVPPPLIKHQIITQLTSDGSRIESRLSDNNIETRASATNGLRSSIELQVVGGDCAAVDPAKHLSDSDAHHQQQQQQQQPPAKSKSRSKPKLKWNSIEENASNSSDQKSNATRSESSNSNSNPSANRNQDQNLNASQLISLSDGKTNRSTSIQSQSQSPTFYNHEQQMHRLSQLMAPNGLLAKFRQRSTSSQNDSQLSNDDTVKFEMYDRILKAEPFKQTTWLLLFATTCFLALSLILSALQIYLSNHDNNYHQQQQQQWWWSSRILLLVSLACVIQLFPLAYVIKMITSIDDYSMNQSSKKDELSHSHPLDRLQLILLISSTSWATILTILNKHLVALLPIIMFIIYTLLSVDHRAAFLVTAIANALHLISFMAIEFYSNYKYDYNSNYNHDINKQQNLQENYSRVGNHNNDDNNNYYDDILIIYYQVLSYIIVYLIFHLIGLHLNRKSQEKCQESFNDIKSYVSAKIMMDTEDKKLTKLMESVIPKHLAGRMRDDILLPQNKGNFNNIYLDFYDEVSILFADIVNFTKISSDCSAKLLVETLNELFGRFDKAADKNNCLRIKILGDCYYCVSGIPDQSEDHAARSVEMGLDMIEILGELAQDNSGVDLNMRVGIHSGRALCGVLGKKKWQFDVHSNDVKLANHMEQAGVPGRVHITEDTLRALNGRYKVEQANGHLRDTYIAQRAISTYFVISPPERRASQELSNQQTINTIRTTNYQQKSKSKNPTATAASGSNSSSQGPKGSLCSQTTTETSTSTSKSESNHSLASGSGGATVLANVSPEATGVLTTSPSLPNATSTATATATTTAATIATVPSSVVVTGAAIKTEAAATGGGQLPVRNLSTASTIKSACGSATSSASVSLHGTSNGVHWRNSNSTTATTTAPTKTTATTTNMSSNPHGPKLRFRLATQRVINALHFIRTIDAPFANLGAPITNAERMLQDTIISRCQIQDIHKFSLKFKDEQMGRLYRVGRSGGGCGGSRSGSGDGDVPPSSKFRSMLKSLLIHLTIVGCMVFLMSQPFLFPSHNQSESPTRTPTTMTTVGLMQNPSNNSNLNNHPSYSQNATTIMTTTLTSGDSSPLRPKPLSPPPPPPPLPNNQDQADDMVPGPTVATKFTTETKGMQVETSIALMVAIVVVFLTTLAVFLHQTELNSRRDFLWRQIAIKDKDRMSQMRDCNRFIFFNLLPPHVASYFLEQKTARNHMDLYHKSYERIGVIFATISNFSDFYSEVQGNNHGLECLRVLNEIICDFDSILDDERFKAVDKIKTIGSTYMAAIGLFPHSELPPDPIELLPNAASPLTSSSPPASKDSDSTDNIVITKNLGNRNDEQQTKAQAQRLAARKEVARYLQILVRFVLEMKLRLQDINEHSFNNFKLRVGINLGPVTAGVIGASKPQYDIWGNTVNVASRMESTAEANKIQITEEVYEILKDLNQDSEYKFTCRGSINVKGKGFMTTYYLDES